MQCRLIAVALATVACGAVRPAEAGETGRVIVLAVTGASPAGEDVASALSRRLSEVGMATEVAVEAAASVPETRDAWIAVARTTCGRPGTIALFGYDCEARACRLTIVDPKHAALAVVPVTLPADGTESDAADQIAAAARSALLGVLFAEMERIGLGAAAPTVAVVRQPLEEPAPPPVEEEVSGRPWLAVEGGYHGDLAYPGGRAIHGPWVGLSAAPHDMVSIALGVGWLGVDERETSIGTATAHRLPVTTALGVVFPIGPAALSLSALGRFDAVFGRTNPAGARGTSRETGFEAHVGGMAAWRLPIVSRLEALVGVGALATVHGSDLDIDDETVIEKSAVRVIWIAGLAWGLVGVDTSERR